MMVLTTLLLLSLTTIEVNGFIQHNILSIKPFVRKTKISSSTTNDVYNSSDESSSFVTFQYSPSSLKHLEATELPDDYSRPWTKEKFLALGGAFGIGGLCYTLGTSFSANFLQLEADSESMIGLFVGAVGIAAGWYLSGGGDVMESEQAKNGGYDRKLLMDKPSRLHTVLQDLSATVKVVEKRADTRDLTLALRYIRTVHGDEYLNLVRSKSEQTDRPTRFNPLYARTLIDQFSYDAAVHAVADWIDSVDAAGTVSPKFALVRPPSHHACKSKAMGGCIFNSVSIAAFYALDQPKVHNVAILDIDAHHGNGIAHCVEDEPRIRYCSIHEEIRDSDYMMNQKLTEDDPRSPKDSDHGPLGNISNINLKSGSGWTAYKDALLEKALPFLMESDPTLLIVAAGFDAMTNDGSSRLSLMPDDYEKIANELHQKFGNRVAFGLEGGYSWQDHGLSQALLAFVKPWQKSS